MFRPRSWPLSLRPKPRLTLGLALLGGGDAGEEVAAAEGVGCQGGGLQGEQPRRARQLPPRLWRREEGRKERSVSRVVAAAVDHHCQVAHCWVVVRLYILPQELRQGRDLIRHREGRATCGVWIPNRFCLTLISSLYGNFDNGRHTFSTNMVKQSQRLLQIGVLSNSRIAASGSCLSLEPFIEPREDSRNRLIREKQPIRVAQRQVTERCSASGLTRRNRLCRPTVHC